MIGANTAVSGAPAQCDSQLRRRLVSEIYVVWRFYCGVLKKAGLEFWEVTSAFWEFSPTSSRLPSGAFPKARGG